MFQRWRETRSHWNLPHCTKHLSPHSTLHSLSLHQLAAIAHSTNIHLCLPLWKMFLKWLCPSICPCVTQLYLHKVSFSCIIREEIHRFCYLLPGSVFVPFHIALECTLRASALLSRNHTKVVWKTYEMESQAEVGSGTRTQRRRRADTSTVTPVSTIIPRSDTSWTLGCVFPWVNRKFSSVTKSCVL